MGTNIKGETLRSELMQIAVEGFVQQENCFFLKKLAGPQTHVKRSDFFDDVAYECFVNAIHIDDYVDANFLGQGILLMNEVFKSWQSYNPGQKLKCIIGETDFGMNIKFHVKRDGIKWIEESDIEGFEEGIIVFES